MKLPAMIAVGSATVLLGAAAYAVVSSPTLENAAQQAIDNATDAGAVNTNIDDDPAKTGGARYANGLDPDPRDKPKPPPPLAAGSLKGSYRFAICHGVTLPPSNKYALNVGGGNASGFVIIGDTTVALNGKVSDWGVANLVTDSGPFRVIVTVHFLNSHDTGALAFDDNQINVLSTPGNYCQGTLRQSSS